MHFSYMLWMENLKVYTKGDQNHIQRQPLVLFFDVFGLLIVPKCDPARHVKENREKKFKPGISREFTFKACFAEKYKALAYLNYSLFAQILLLSLCG